MAARTAIYYVLLVLPMLPSSVFSIAAIFYKAFVLQKKETQRISFVPCQTILDRPIMLRELV